MGDECSAGATGVTTPLPVSNRPELAVGGLAGAEGGGRLVGDGRPGRVRVIHLHGLELFERLGSEVLLVHDSAVADDEGLHSAHPVFRGGRGQSKAADHQALGNKIDLPQRRGGTLAFQDLEIVSVIRLEVVLVALRYHPGDCGPYRSLPDSVAVLPGETIMLSRR